MSDITEFNDKNVRIIYKPRPAYRLEFLPHITEEVFAAYKDLCARENISMASDLCSFIKGRVRKTEREVKP